MSRAPAAQLFREYEIAGCEYATAGLSRGRPLSLLGVYPADCEHYWHAFASFACERTRAHAHSNTIKRPGAAHESNNASDLGASRSSIPTLGSCYSTTPQHQAGRSGQGHSRAAATFSMLTIQHAYNSACLQFSMPRADSAVINGSVRVRGGCTAQRTVYTPPSAPAHAINK